jgi:hypothetical protein
MRTAAFALVMFVSCCATQSATPPPAWPGSDAITWPLSMRFAPTKGVTFNSFRITFEDTSLYTVAAKLGGGAISHHGDAAGSEYWLCYTVRTDRRSERIWVVSNGEMGGPESAVTGVVAISLPLEDSSNDCPELSPSFVPVSLDRKIWLGSSAAAVSRALGKPSHEAPPWRSYSFQAKVESGGKCDGGYDLINSLDVKVRAGVVVAIAAGQVTSC